MPAWRPPEHDGGVMRRLTLLPRALAWVGVGAALALVFASYLQPSLVFELANRVWACF